MESKYKTEIEEVKKFLSYSNVFDEIWKNEMLKQELIEKKDAEYFEDLQLEINSEMKPLQKVLSSESKAFINAIKIDDYNNPFIKILK